MLFIGIKIIFSVFFVDSIWDGIKFVKVFYFRIRYFLLKEVYLFVMDFVKRVFFKEKREFKIIVLGIILYLFVRLYVN